MQANCVSFTANEKEQLVISWSESDKKGRGERFYMSFFDEQERKFSDRINIPLEENVSLHEAGLRDK
jgi:hypothetical protein